MTTETMRFVTADGETLPLPFTRGIEGRGLRPTSRQYQRNPGGGARRRWQTFDEGEVVVPVFYEGTAEAVRTWQRNAARLLGTTEDAPGLLVVDSLLDDTRQIDATYAGGFELVEEKAPYLSLALVFSVFDDWTDATDTVVRWTGGEAGTPFFPIPNAGGNFIPLSRGLNSVGRTITNDGDRPAWPVWRITGPVTNPVRLTNETTGKVLELATTLLAGESILIDTRPGARTITRVDTGANLYGTQSATSELYPLERGPNALTLAVNGTTGATTVELVYRRRWRSA